MCCPPKLENYAILFELALIWVNEPKYPPNVWLFFTSSGGNFQRNASSEGIYANFQLWGTTRKFAQLWRDIHTKNLITITSINYYHYYYHSILSNIIILLVIKIVVF